MHIKIMSHLPTDILRITYLHREWVGAGGGCGYTYICNVCGATSAQTTACGVEWFARLEVYVRARRSTKRCLLLMGITFLRYMRINLFTHVYVRVLHIGLMTPYIHTYVYIHIYVVRFTDLRQQRMQGYASNDDDASSEKPRVKIEPRHHWRVSE